MYFLFGSPMIPKLPVNDPSCYIIGVSFLFIYFDSVTLVLVPYNLVEYEWVEYIKLISCFFSLQLQVTLQQDHPLNAVYEKSCVTYLTFVTMSSEYRHVTVSPSPSLSFCSITISSHHRST